jgi:hypothetical protein
MELIDDDYKGISWNHHMEASIGPREEIPVYQAYCLRIGGD